MSIPWRAKRTMERNKCERINPDKINTHVAVEASHFCGVKYFSISFLRCQCFVSHSFFSRFSSFSLSLSPFGLKFITNFIDFAGFENQKFFTGKRNTQSLCLVLWIFDGCFEFSQSFVWQATHVAFGQRSRRKKRKRSEWAHKICMMHTFRLFSVFHRFSLTVLFVSIEVVNFSCNSSLKTRI